ncbi:MAG: L,D-transpeptidase family protein [Alphaproteobacteria bacterium]|nr:L,D-transpeptidase family protein [Alphaproteobacteria bacterium]MBV9371684.1 L,D-transpeptidase family protein [Alphaproteobacteria bacterium]MBV9902460.1 L,D-transpeptidase family protein [Alphaproteobacteria bacterium]
MKGRCLSLAALAALAACERAPAPPPRGEPHPAAASYGRVDVGPDLASFYAARGNRPLWVARRGVRPGAERAVRRIADAGDDGLDPARYGAADLQAALAAARQGDPGALAHFELLLSRAFTAYVRDLRVPRTASLALAEPDVGPSAPPPRAVLEALAAAPSLSGGIDDATRMNPLYEALRRGNGRWRAGRRSGDEALVRANLDRARAIPAGGRAIVVDTASARLWMIDGQRVEGPMRVIVGKPNMQTPMLASRLRWVVLNPYWNIPPDLARERARKVLRQGPGLIARENIEILSDWSDSARPIPAAAVSWGAVASGRRSLRLRQRPGGANVMGKIKFMMENRLGIYLHDFPDKSLFARDDRRLSSGCVRLSDAPRLARWLFRGTPPQPRGRAPEQRVDLPEPVPVYLTYLTVLPGGPEGLTFQPDSYARERGRTPIRQAGVKED